MIANLFGEQEPPVSGDFKDTFILPHPVTRAGKTALYEWVGQVMEKAENINYQYIQGTEAAGKYGYEYRVTADKASGQPAPGKIL